MAKPGVDFVLEQCQLQLERQLRHTWRSILP
jgi:hypothetical protein